MNIMIRHTRIDATLLDPFFADNYSYVHLQSVFGDIYIPYNTKTANCFVSNMRYRLAVLHPSGRGLNFGKNPLLRYSNFFFARWTLFVD